MRKVKLELDALVVESFTAVDAEVEGIGTVQANAITPAITCRLSCQTCGGSCDTGDPVCNYC